MTPSPPKQQEHFANAPIFFRESIPKSVLGMIALVAVALFGYSYAFVQPNILRHYRSICDRNLQSVGLSNLTNPASDSTRSTSPESPSSTVSLDDRIQRLEETLLCLRRLINADSVNDSLRFELALVAENLALCFHQKAKSESLNPTDLQQPNLFQQRAQSEHHRAIESMRAAAKLDGALQHRASLFLAATALRDNPFIPLDELAQIERQTRQALSANVENVQASGVLSQALVQQALCPSYPVTNEARVQLLNEARELLASKPVSDMDSAAFQAELLFGLDPIESQKIAWQATQSFWQVTKSNALSAASLSSVFECLVLAGSLKESQTFLTEQFGQIPPFEQMELRKRASITCLRLLVASLLRTNPSASQINLDLLLFNSSLQLDPESSELLYVLDSLANPNLDRPLMQTLAKRIMSGPDPRLKDFMTLLTTLYSNSTDADTVALVTSIKLSPALGVATARLAARISTNQPERNESLVRVLAEVNRQAPDVLAVWSERAALHSKLKQFPQAVECLEFLTQKLPDNIELKNALEAAKKRVQN